MAKANNWVLAAVSEYLRKALSPTDVLERALSSSSIV